MKKQVFVLIYVLTIFSLTACATLPKGNAQLERTKSTEITEITIPEWVNLDTLTDMLMGFWASGVFN